MKSFWIVLVGRIVQMATAFVALRAMSTVLGPEEVGRFSIIVAITTFFALMFINPVGMYVNRRLHSWQAQGLLPNKLKIYSVFVFAVAAAALLSVPLVNMWLGHPWPISGSWLAPLVAASLIFTTFNQTLIPSLNLLDHRVLWLIFSTLTLWLSLAASLFFVRFGANAEHWQLGQILGFMIGLGLATPWFFKVTTRQPTAVTNRTTSIDTDDSFRRIWSFAAPLTISVGLAWCQFQSYRLYVGHWISIEDLGRFVGVYSLVAGLMAAFENLIQQYFYPRLYSESALEIDASTGTAPRIAWTRFASVAIPVSIIGGLTLIAVGPLLVRLMLAPSFQSAAGFVLVIAVVETARVVSNIYGMAAHVTLKTKTLLIPQFLGTALLLLLVPLCFSLKLEHLETIFLISLGLPSLVLVFSNAVIIAKEIHVALPLSTLKPCFVAALFTVAFAFINASLGMNLRPLLGVSVVAILLFSSLMGWAVLAWRRTEAGVDGEN